MHFADLCVLYTGQQLRGMLSQPEIISGLAYDENGVAYQEVENFPNPAYLEGWERQTVQFVYNLLPGGQVAQCVGRGQFDDLSWLPAYSLVFIAVTTGIGVIYFGKKDLK